MAYSEEPLPEDAMGKFMTYGAVPVPLPPPPPDFSNPKFRQTSFPGGLFTVNSTATFEVSVAPRDSQETFKKLAKEELGDDFPLVFPGIQFTDDGYYVDPEDGVFTDSVTIQAFERKRRVSDWEVEKNYLTGRLRRQIHDKGLLGDASTIEWRLIRYDEEEWTLQIRAKG